MCLHSVDEKPKAERGSGYKVFWKPMKDLPLRTPVVGLMVPEDQWIDDNPAYNTLKSIGGEDTRYLSGFHIFLSRTDADEYIDGPDELVREVEFEEVVATGLQKTGKWGERLAPTVVARRMKICPE